MYSYCSRKVFYFHSSFFEQWYIASLGAGPPQQEDQTHRVSDRQAEEDCEMYRGMRPRESFIHISLSSLFMPF